MAKVILLVIVGIVVLLLITSGILYFLYSRQWPVKIYLTNHGAATKFDLYANGFHQGQYTLPPNKKTTITIDDGLKNERTGGSLERNQFKTMALEFKEQISVSFSKGNLPSNYKLVLSKDQAGFAPLDRKHPNPGNMWTSKGFYVISLPNGVNVF